MNTSVIFNKTLNRLMPDHENLNPELKKVAFEKGTERPYSGKYVTETAPGTYHCAVCGSPLFPSTAKFETQIPGLRGWPSFEDAIPGALEFRSDTSLGMERTEVVCAKCEAHLGHLFDDGKAESKTGKHFCINSVCLDLKKEPPATAS